MRSETIPRKRIKRNGERAGAGGGRKSERRPRKRGTAVPGIMGRGRCLSRFEPL